VAIAAASWRCRNADYDGLCRCVPGFKRSGYRGECEAGHFAITECSNRHCRVPRDRRFHSVCMLLPVRGGRPVRVVVPLLQLARAASIDGA
jgi:hypothetical protein